MDDLKKRESVSKAGQSVLSVIRDDFDGQAVQPASNTSETPPLAGEQAKRLPLPHCGVDGIRHDRGASS